MIDAQIILDSVSPYSGKRLTTLQLWYPRYIHSHLLTYRAFSRNTSSSRAIPVSRYIENVKNDPALPLVWYKNKRGMWSDKIASKEDTEKAISIVENLRLQAIDAARQLNELRMHKQHVNRYLEPFTHVSVIVSSTDFQNMFDQRITHDTQPETHLLAFAIKNALDNSDPVEPDEGWHIPYIRKEEKLLPLGSRVLVGIARCARVSYQSNKTGKVSSVEEDISLCTRLYEDKHPSPFEHVALASSDGTGTGNFDGWKQARHMISEIGGFLRDISL